jgi:uncharacterized protein (TIGR03086 family)
VDAFEQLDQAAHEFERRLALVGGDDWDRPTPCDEWTVRDLVNHVIGGCVRYTMLLQGAAAAELLPTRTQDHIGGDAMASYRARTAEVRAAFMEPGALQRTGHHPSGDRSGAGLLEMRITDCAIHAWDLARALGADEQLDASLVQTRWELMSKVAGSFAGTTYFAAPVDPGPDAPIQARLLALVGRRP